VSSCARTPRLPGCANGYGLFTTHWSGDASPLVTAVLQTLIAVQQS
jgi:hypothetical protein